MKRWFETRAYLCFVLILVMGIFPGSVLALETSDSESITALTTPTEQEVTEKAVPEEVVNEQAVTEEAVTEEAVPEEAVADSIEMLPGDFATDDGSVESDSARETLKAASLFTPRLTAPGKDNVYYFAKNIFYQSGYGMPNCTAYAWGRAYEILGTKPNLSTGNANQFWGYNLSRNNYSYGTTPKVGAIICWNGSACGHVAVVEAISGNKVTISESAWSGAFFRTYSYNIGSENSTSVGGFQGYIYVNGTNDDITPPTISNPQITDIDDQGFTVTCQVSDAGSGINRVLFPTWTDEGGQNDLVWYTATVSGNTASRRILYSDHNNERGNYTIHIYAYDQLGNTAIAGLTAIVRKNIDSSYQTHIQDIGWQGWKLTPEISGTTGLSKRLEAIEVKLDTKGYDLGVAYQTHIQDIGWQGWVDNGNISGTSGRSLRLEAIKIKLTGNDADKYDIYYRVHAQNIGWMDWARNGESSGTAGLCYRLEAIEIEVVPTGSAAPGATSMAFMSK